MQMLNLSYVSQLSLLFLDGFNIEVLSATFAGTVAALFIVTSP